MSVTYSTVLDHVLDAARSVLDAPDIGPVDNFFERGGDSLAVIELCSRLESERGVEIPLEFVWDSETFEAVAQRIQAMETTPDR